MCVHQTYLTKLIWASVETKYGTKNDELHVLCSFIMYTSISFDSHTVLVPQQKSNIHYFMFVPETIIQLF